MSRMLHCSRNIVVVVVAVVGLRKLRRGQRIEMAANEVRRRDVGWRLRWVGCW